MNLDKKLNLLIPVELEDGTETQVHATPLSNAVFERHFRILSRVYNTIHSEGHGLTGGPRIAHLLLKETAEEMGVWEGKNGVEATLMAEIRRLTNVAAIRDDGHGGKGWSLVPFDSNQARELLGTETISEVEGKLVFFTLISAMCPRKFREATLASAGGLCDFQPTSSSFTDLIASLPISTQAAATGETAIPSPIAG